MSHTEASASHGEKYVKHVWEDENTVVVADSVMHMYSAKAILHAAGTSVESELTMAKSLIINPIKKAPYPQISRHCLQ